MFGNPIPILTIDIGIPLHRPVMVKNPLSDERIKGFGLSSRKAASFSALEEEPTVSCVAMSNTFQMYKKIDKQSYLQLLLAVRRGDIHVGLQCVESLGQET
jgi:hypothetical protein